MSGLKQPVYGKTCWMDGQSDRRLRKGSRVNGGRTVRWIRGSGDSWCRQTGCINICYDLLGTGGIICKALLEIRTVISFGLFLSYGLSTICADIHIIRNVLLECWEIGICFKINDGELFTLLQYINRTFRRDVVLCILCRIILLVV